MVEPSAARGINGSQSHVNGIHNMSAVRLLSSVPTNRAGCIVMDPPSRLGVGEAEDETPIEEMISVLSPLAEQAFRGLCPGGAVLFMGDPLPTSAWELCAAWAGFRLVAEMVVLWVQNEGRRIPGSEVASLTMPIRWHVKPGLRFGRGSSIDLPSNIIVSHPVPVLHRMNPAQKPLELFNYLISITTLPGDVVVDPFCGAGSALVAAADSDRRWLGGDIDPEQCDIATGRVLNHGLEYMDTRPIYWWLSGNVMQIGGQ